LNVSFRRPSGLSALIAIAVGQLFSAVGSRMTTFALSIWVWEATGRATDFALLTVVALGATVLFSPIAGALVDRWNRRVTMILSDFGAALATGVLLLLFLTDSAQVWHLYVVNFVSGAFMAFQAPAYTALIAVTLEKRHFPRAGAVFSLVTSAPAIVAPGLAAALLAVTGVYGVLAIDLVTFAVAVALIFLVAVPQQPTSAQPEKRQHVLRDAVFGFRYVWTRHVLRRLLMVQFSIAMFSGFGWVLMTPLIMARTGDDANQVAIVNMVGAVGGVLGGLVLTALPSTRRKAVRMLLAMLVFGALGRALFGLGFSTPIWSASLFFAWACLPFMNGYGTAIWQEKVNPQLQGRVTATRQLLEGVSLPLAIGVTGPLIDFVLEPAMRPGGSLAGVFGGVVGTEPGAGMALVFLVTGALACLVGVFGLATRDVRDIEKLVPDHDAPSEEPAMASR